MSKRVAFALFPDELERLWTLPASDFKAAFGVLGLGMGLALDVDENPSAVALFAGNSLAGQYARSVEAGRAKSQKSQAAANYRWHAVASGGIRENARCYSTETNTVTPTKTLTSTKLTGMQPQPNPALLYSQRPFTEEDVVALYAESEARLAKFGLETSKGGGET